MAVGFSQTVSPVDSLRQYHTAREFDQCAAQPSARPTFAFSSPARAACTTATPATMTGAAEAPGAALRAARLRLLERAKAAVRAAFVAGAVLRPAEAGANPARALPARANGLLAASTSTPLDPPLAPPLPMPVALTLIARADTGAKPNGASPGPARETAERTLLWVASSIESPPPAPLVSARRFALLRRKAKMTATAAMTARMPAPAPA